MKQSLRIIHADYFRGKKKIGEFSRVIFHANFLRISVELFNTERLVKRQTHYEANRRIFASYCWERRSQWLHSLRRRSVGLSRAEIVASNPTGGMD